MNNPKRDVECIIPVLRVEDLRRSIRFYSENLGFAIDWGANEGDTICSISRDGCCIMLCEDGRGSRGTWVWIGLEDESLFDSLKKQGIKILQEPKNRPWAYEMKIEDIDGNVLWLGTEPRKDEPFEVDTTQPTFNQNGTMG